MFGKHCAIWILVIGSCAGLMSCSSHALYEAQETVATADSLWHNGQSFSDSTQLAQAYRTLHRRRNMYPDEYAHACYHYGKLLRAQDDPAAAMQVFIHATHSRSNDYHILGRVYSNMGDLCHLAEEFPLAYDMYERSGEMYLRNGDTLLYYYDLNNMAFELAEQGRKEETYAILDNIYKNCNDRDIYIKTIETKAIACKMVQQYDSTIYYTSLSFQYGNYAPTIILSRAQTYSLMDIKDSAVYYANILLEHYSDVYNQCNALYIITNDDESQGINGVRTAAAQRADTQKLIEGKKSRLANAVQLLKQDINRKPDLRWLYSMIASLIIIGVGIAIYVTKKRKKQELLTQKIEELRSETSSIQEHTNELKEQFLTNQKHIEEDVNKQCSLLRTNEGIRKTLAWKNYDKMCSIVDQRFYGLALKLRERYALNETEVRLCILTLLNCEYDRIAELLYRSKTSIGTLKIRIAKKLGTTAKELRLYLIENVCVR